MSLLDSAYAPLGRFFGNLRLVGGALQAWPGPPRPSTRRKPKDGASLARGVTAKAFDKRFVFRYNSAKLWASCFGTGVYARARQTMALQLSGGLAEGKRMRKDNPAIKIVQPGKEAPKVHELTRRTPEVADALRDMRPYDPVSSLPTILENPEREHYKLDWNECTLPPSPKVRKALQVALDGMVHLNYYPQLFAQDLRLRLQSYVGYPADHILVTNGSDDALDLISKTYLNYGDRVLSPYPTYTHCLLFAQSRGAIIDKVMPQNPFTTDVEGLLAEIHENTKLIYLVSPNNPTGQVYSEADVLRICSAAPQAIVIVDEAYWEFSQVSRSDLIARLPNLIITRTFSKVFGLAALRVGYVVAQPRIIEQLTRLHNPKSVNQLAQVAAAAALDDLDYYDRYVEQVTRSKKLFGRWCQSHDIEYHDTPANFGVVRIEKVKEVVDGLAQRGVYVRDRSSFPGLEGCFRINLGTVEQTTQVILHFEQVLADLGLL